MTLTFNHALGEKASNRLSNLNVSISDNLRTAMLHVTEEWDASEYGVYDFKPFY